MNGQMAPGGRDLYYVQAKAGQTMNVSLSSAAPLTFQSTIPRLPSPAPPTAAR